MTLKDWNRREDFRSSWKSFYASETGKALKEVLTHLGLPVPTMPPQNVSFSEWNSSLNARREGYFEAVRLLSALCEDPTLPEEFPAPWENKTENQTEQS